MSALGVILGAGPRLSFEEYRALILHLEDRCAGVAWQTWGGPPLVRIPATRWSELGPLLALPSVKLEITGGEHRIVVLNTADVVRIAWRFPRTHALPDPLSSMRMLRGPGGARELVFAPVEGWLTQAPKAVALAMMPGRAGEEAPEAVFAVDAAWAGTTQPDAAQPDVWRTDDEAHAEGRELARTLQAADVTVLRAGTFGAGRVMVAVPAPMPMPISLPAHEASDATRLLPTYLRDASIGVDHADAFSATEEVDAEEVRRKAGMALPPGFAAPAHADEEDGGTVLARPSREVLEARAAFGERLTPTRVPELGVEQYAELLATLEVRGESDAPTLQRFGVFSEATRRALDESFRARFIASAAEEARFHAWLVHHRDRLHGARGAR